MNLMRLPNLVLAALLVLLLPLEQAHCACGSPASQVARATAAAPACPAACCAAPAARPAEHRGCPDQDPRGCACDHLAAADLSVVLTASPPETSVMSFTTPLASDVICLRPSGR